MMLEFLKALLYGIVEGVTEWLPISSTGHLILLGEWLPFRFTDDVMLAAAFWEMFEVMIQLGAILAVIVRYWRRLCPFGAQKSHAERRQSWALWGKVALGCLPAALVGVLGDRLLERWTAKDLHGWLYSSTVVAVALIVYGVAFLWVERWREGRACTVSCTEVLSCRTAWQIGLFQALSLVPGTSRSGATILGAMLLGLSRPAAAEFSFFLAVPVMAGAGGIKALGFASFLKGSGSALPSVAWGLLAVGCVTAFAVSAVSIRFLTDHVKRHRFSVFGYYRIALGALVLLYFGVFR